MKIIKNIIVSILCIIGNTTCGMEPADKIYLIPFPEDQSLSDFKQEGPYEKFPVSREIAEKSEYIKTAHQHKINKKGTPYDPNSDPLKNNEEFFIETDNKEALKDLITLYTQEKENIPATLPLENLLNIANSNLINFLQIEPLKEDIHTTLLSKIKQEKLSNLLSLKELNDESAQKITHELVKKERIDAKLMKSYQEKLSPEPITLHVEKKLPSETSDLLFFNDKIFIYGLYLHHLKGPGLDHFTKIIIKDRKDASEKVIWEKQKPFDSYKDPLLQHIFVSPNGSFCILQYEQRIHPANGPSTNYTFHSLDIKNTRIQQLYGMTTTLPSLPIIKEPPLAWSFASDDMICTTYGNNILLINLKNNEETLIPIPDHSEQNIIKKIACYIPDKNKPENATIALITQENNPRRANRPLYKTFIIKDNEKIEVENDDFNTHPLQTYTIQHLFINPQDKKAYIIIKYPAAIFDESPLFSFNLEDKKPIIKEIVLTPDIESRAGRLEMEIPAFFTNNIFPIKKNTLMMYAFISRELTNSLWPMEATYPHDPIYFFTIPATNNTWYYLSNRGYIAMMSNDGRQSIETTQGKNILITLYDNNMLQTLDYFNTKKEDLQNSAQSKLLTTLLIRRLINHPKNFIYLNDIETKIYYDMPQAMQNILETIYKISPSENYTVPENFHRINPKKVNVLRNNLNDYSQSVKKAFSNFGQQLFNWWNSKPTP